jgi:hypothetical protein
MNKSDSYNQKATGRISLKNKIKAQENANESKAKVSNT